MDLPILDNSAPITAQDATRTPTASELSAKRDASFAALFTVREQTSRKSSTRENTTRDDTAYDRETAHTSEATSTGPRAQSASPATDANNGTSDHRDATADDSDSVGPHDAKTQNESSDTTKSTAAESSNTDSSDAETAEPEATGAEATEPEATESETTGSEAGVAIGTASPEAMLNSQTNEQAHVIAGSSPAGSEPTTVEPATGATEPVASEQASEAGKEPQTSGRNIPQSTSPISEGEAAVTSSEAAASEATSSGAPGATGIELTEASGEHGQGKDRKRSQATKQNLATSSGGNSKYTPGLIDVPTGLAATDAMRDTAAQLANALSSPDNGVDQQAASGAQANVDDQSSATSQNLRVSGPVGRGAEALQTQNAPPTEGDRGLSQLQQVRLIQRVARAVEAAPQQGGTLRLRLSPPELGSLRLEVTMEQGSLTAKLEAETQMARSVLLESLPQLRDRLEEQGIHVEQFDVDVAEQNMGQAQEQADQAQQQDGASGPDSDSTNQEEGEEDPSSAGNSAPQIISQQNLNVVI